MRRIRTVSIVAAGLLGAAASTAAFARSEPFLSLGSPMAAPRGFVEMCEHGDRSFCGPINGAGDEKVVTGALIGAGFTAVPADRDAAPRWEVAAPACTSGPVAGLRPVALSTSEAAQPRSCGDPAGSPADALVAAPALNKAAFRHERQLIDRVNRRVNGRVVQRTDAEIYGRNEVWVRSGIQRGAQGDCEDLAIEKRHELLDAGFDPKRLSFAVVYRGDIGLHTVLLVRTAEGDEVLDSRTPYVERWDQVPYVWVGVQSQTRPMEWRMMGRPGTDLASTTGPSPAA